MKSACCAVLGLLVSCGVEEAHEEPSPSAPIYSEEEEVASTTAAASGGQGASLQGASLQGASLQGASLQGASLQGASLQGASLQGASLQGASLQGIGLDGTVLQGAALQGLVLSGTAVRRDGTTVRIALRLDAVATDPTTNAFARADLQSNADVELYTVSYLDDGGTRWPFDDTWRPLCPAAPGEAQGQAVALAGTWSAEGDHTPSETSFTFGCTVGVLAKCVRTWGYKPWKTVADPSTGVPVALRDYHLACARAAMADFCGAGTSYTQNGTLVDLYDDRGFVRPEDEATSVPGFAEESSFGVDGAGCVVRTRYQDIATQCPDYVGDDVYILPEFVFTAGTRSQCLGRRVRTGTRQLIFVDTSRWCRHDECTTGEFLARDCTPCTRAVCEAAPECCHFYADASDGPLGRVGLWSSQCVQLAQRLCGKCNASEAHACAGGGCTVPPDDFSSRWTGVIVPRFTSHYTFSVGGSDGVRVRVAERWVANSWPTEEPQGGIDLIAGVRYPITVEHYEGTGAASARLYWETYLSPEQPREIVPQSQLYPQVIPNGVGNGLRGTYFAAKDLWRTSSQLKLERLDANINFDWAGGSPDPSLPVDGFSVHWEGYIEPRHSETYTFYTRSDDGVRLEIDDRVVIDNWTDHAITENSGTIKLQAGHKYKIELDYYESWGGAIIGLSWSSPSTPKQIVPQSALYSPRVGGLRGEYFDDKNLTGSRHVRTDSQVAFAWGDGAPAPGVGASTFSVRWTGYLHPKYRETYTIHTQTDDGVRLWINDQLLIDDWHDHGTTERSATIALEPHPVRPYRIRMEYYDNGGGATARLLWSSPSTPKQVIPWWALGRGVDSSGGLGLSAEYFEGRHFWKLLKRRVESAINLSWGYGSP